MGALPPSLMCSVAEAAQLMGVSPQTVRNLINRGDFPTPVRTAGTRTLINRQLLEDWCNGIDHTKEQAS